MQVFIDDQEEAKRKAEIEQYDAEMEAQMAEKSANAKAKRVTFDKRFRQIGGGTVLLIIAIVFYRWLRGY